MSMPFSAMLRRYEPDVNTFPPAALATSGGRPLDKHTERTQSSKIFVIVDRICMRLSCSSSEKVGTASAMNWTRRSSQSKSNSVGGATEMASFDGLCCTMSCATARTQYGLF